MPVVWVLTFSLLISAGAISAAALFLLAPRALQQKVLPYLICFAIGTLLASALVELLPHAIDEVGATPSLMIVLTGLVGFFVLERWMIWHHCHVLGTCDVHVAVAP